MQCSGHLRCPCRQNQMLINLIAYLLFVSFFFLPCSSAALVAGRRSQRVCRIAGDPLSQKSPLLQLHCQLLLVKLLNREQSLRLYFYMQRSSLCLKYAGSSCLMRISLLRISLLRFFKTITKIWLMRFYGLFILLLRT